MIIKANGKEVDAAKMLLALHNHTVPRGMGVAQTIDHLRLDTCQGLVAQMSTPQHFNFDYFLGRPLKVWVNKNGELLGGELYTRDAGSTHAFEHAIATALSTPDNYDDLHRRR